MKTAMILLLIFTSSLVFANGNTTGGGIPLKDGIIFQDGGIDYLSGLPDSVRKTLELNGIHSSESEHLGVINSGGGAKITVPYINSSTEYGPGGTGIRGSVDDEPFNGGETSPIYDVTYAGPGNGGNDDVVLTDSGSTKAAVYQPTTDVFSTSYGQVVLSNEETNWQRIHLIMDAATSNYQPTQVQVGDFTANNGFVVNFVTSPRESVEMAPLITFNNSYGTYIRNIDMDGTSATFETGSLTTFGINSVKTRTMNLNEVPSSLKEAYMKSFFSMERQWVPVD